MCRYRVAIVQKQQQQQQHDINLHFFTRITNNSNSLIDHIYANDNEQHVKEIKVSKMAISGHFAVCMTWKKQGLISVNQAKNIISYRDKKHFNSEKCDTLFVDDLITFTNLDDNLESVHTMVKEFDTYIFRDS